MQHHTAFYVFIFVHIEKNYSQLLLEKLLVVVNSDESETHFWPTMLRIREEHH